jgi:aminopeptidase N
LGVATQRSTRPSPIVRRLLAVLLVGTVVGAAAAPATAAPAPPTPGAPGVGDALFPLAGNGGYDVGQYDLDLRWNPTTGELAGTARISAVAEQALSRFDLDLRAFTVTALTVDGRPATFTRSGQELIVTPATAIKQHAHFAVVVTYHGVPETVIDPDGSPDGWQRTADGGAFVVAEPQGAPSWFPANDHPTDKATFSLSMTVPNGLEVLGNGLPGLPVRIGGNTRYSWFEQKPMAPYLATVAVGDFQLQLGRSKGGVPIISGVAPQLAADSAASLARTGEILDWEASLFGPYPFETAGAIIVDAPDVGYSLETQTRPTYTEALADDELQAHELSHQWLGDSVSLERWSDIWLNEGFATYTEWMWSEHDGGATAQERFDEVYAIPASSSFWSIPPVPVPEPSELFGGQNYERGAMTLHVLRTTIGDKDFFKLLRQWASTNRYGNVSTADFIALAEKVSHRQLDALFNAWLMTPGKPALS